MPIPIEFTRSDMNQGRIVEPAWYRMKIQNITEQAAKPSEKGPSTNYVTEGIILRNADNGTTDYAEIPITWNFNSKAKGFIVTFLKCFGVDVKEGVRYDIMSAIGREIDVFVENDTWNNRTINRVNHKYRPVNQ